MDRILSGASLTIIQDDGRSNLIDCVFRREYCDGRIITSNTLPLIRNSTCPAVSVSCQDHRLTSAIDFRNSNLNIGTETENFKRHRGGFTTMGALHNNRVNARSADLFRGVGTEGCFACPFIFIVARRNHHCSEGSVGIGTITVLTKDIATSDCHHSRHCVNCDGVAACRVLTRIVLVRSLYCENIRTGVRQGCNIEGVGYTGNQCTIHIPFICSMSQLSIRLVLVGNRQGSHTVQTHIFRSALNCQSSQRRCDVERVLIRDKFEGGCISIAREILINGHNDIFVATDRICNGVIVYISSINSRRSFFFPFPHIGLFNT